jgi:hypothetical protein
MRKQGLLIWLALAFSLVGALPAIVAAPAAALTFAPPVHYALGGRPADLASADLNGDGRPDLVASAGPGLDVLLGVGRSGFAPATRVPLDHRPGAVALADLDGSGTQDVVTANLDGTVSVLLGDGDGSLVAKGTYTSGASATYDVVVGDLNSDAVPDVATAGDDDGVRILWGDGTGGLLDAPLRLPVGAGCRHLVAGDLDRDGSLDLAVSRYAWDEYSGFAVLLADGAGGFSVPAFFNTGDDDSSPHGLAACSLNDDGIPDLVALYGYEGGVLYAFLGDGLGLFVRAGQTVFGQGSDEAWGVAVADLNRDGADDVVTIGPRPGYTTGPPWVTVPPGPPRIHILLGGGGAFFKPTSLLAGRLPGEVIAVDLNGDRKPDLATTDLERRSLSVRLRGMPPVLTGLSPAKGRVGRVVTLTGRHFSLRHAVVRFGGTPVTRYISRSDSTIRVRVPRGTARGRVKVTVTTLIGRSAPKAFLRL